MLFFSFSAKSNKDGRKRMSLSVNFVNSWNESAMNVPSTFAMLNCFGAGSTTRCSIKIASPSKVSLITSVGFLFVFSSVMSLGVMDLHADSASCKKGIAFCNSMFASSLSLLIPAAVSRQPAFCTPTSSAFFSALPFSNCTLVSSLFVFSSSIFNTFSCSRSSIFISSTWALASASFSSPVFTAVSCALISSYFTRYNPL
mmetsp:Transcript_19767/g.49743  ORF Transcript_19767/g.49743 Transcript_19767/m.49743 type:complete len:200 (+) Transcript_19767:613-1212(+)